ncbi:MAG TPA: polysaccharide biosynthesis/export family protein [Terriglobales bacterium]|nr:polysaccharide biosynthesis/export family protein [Terriglobales bacterium]
MQSKTLVILALMVLLALPAGAQDATGKAKDKKDAPAVASATNPRVATPLPASATDDPDYEIGPGDMLNISVWKEAELSGTVPVRPDGKVSLPLLSDVPAAGTTPTKLATTIAERLRQYLTDPRVTVIVTAANSRRIYLIGEVVRPGAIPMLPNMTVLQALSTSGGFSQFANVKKMYVLRMENGKQVKIPVNYKAAISGQAPDQNIALKSGDTIVIP